VASLPQRVGVFGLVLGVLATGFGALVGWWEPLAPPGDAGLAAVVELAREGARAVELERERRVGDHDFVIDQLGARAIVAGHDARDGGTGLVRRRRNAGARLRRRERRRRRS
jgi:hypothetical protein